MENSMTARCTSVFAVLVTLATISAGQVASEEALAKKNGCLECHSVNKSATDKLVGPSFPGIAAKYKNDANGRAVLIERVKKGSKGNWTNLSHGVPMPPYSERLSDAEIKRLVQWLLSL